MGAAGVEGVVAVVGVAGVLGVVAEGVLDSQHRYLYGHYLYLTYLQSYCLYLKVSRFLNLFEKTLF